jgi:hypothetical protein
MGEPVDRAVGPVVDDGRLVRLHLGVQRQEVRHGQHPGTAGPAMTGVTPDGPSDLA